MIIERLQLRGGKQIVWFDIRYLNRKSVILNSIGRWILDNGAGNIDKIEYWKVKLKLKEDNNLPQRQWEEKIMEEIKIKNEEFHENYIRRQ